VDGQTYMTLRMMAISIQNKAKLVQIGNPEWQTGMFAPRYYCDVHVYSSAAMPLLIRILQPNDFANGFLETLSSLAPIDLTPEEALVIWNKRSAAGIRTIVAEIDGRVVGTASLIVEQKYIHGGGLVGHIEDVAVHKDHSRKGIGAALVDHLTKLACSLGCYKAILNCLDQLVPFYSRSGYRRHDSGLRFDCSTRPKPE
jgi:glucosamine-phosphate N-acetyltransferase